MAKLFRYPSLFAVLFVGLSACGEQRFAPTQSLEVAAVGLYSAALSDDGQFAIAGSVHHGISAWRVGDQERLYNWSHKEKNHTTMIAADFSPDNQWAITADTHSIALWQLATGASDRFWAAPGEILSVALAKNGASALLGMSDHTAVLFDIRRGGILRTLHHNNRVRSVALSNDTTLAVTGSEDYTAITWDLKTGKPLARIEHEDDVQLVALSGDGSLVLSMSKYDKAIVWHARSGELMGQLPLKAESLKRGLRFTSARFSADNTMLVTGRPDQIVTLWSLPQLKPIRSWRVPKRKAWKPTGAAILDVSFAEGNKLLAAASSGFVTELSY